MQQLKNWLPNLLYPIRLGTHNQSMFAFGLALDWARVAGDDELAALLTRKSREFHLRDRDCPLTYEPSGEDFLSPCLMEADLMRRICRVDGIERVRFTSPHPKELTFSSSTAQL